MKTPAVRWNWNGIEVHGDTIYYIVRVTDADKFYLANLDFNNGSRVWSRKPEKTLVFSCEADAKRFRKKWIGVHSEIFIESASA